jgi:hypothetical protein
LIKNKTEKPRNSIMRLFSCRYVEFLKSRRIQSAVTSVFLLFFSVAQAQNVLEKKILAKSIETISIDGNQIFTISVSTAKTDYITLKSTLDGEYQNQFQIVTVIENGVLNLSLEHLSFTTIADDKRNAHKVIAATLVLEIPDNLNLNILSDVGSVHAEGTFNTIVIELVQGYCEISSSAKTSRINTMEGHITIATQNARINASSNHGNVTLDPLKTGNSIWNLRSINGDITVVKRE